MENGAAMVNRNKKHRISKTFDKDMNASKLQALNKHYKRTSNLGEITEFATAVFRDECNYIVWIGWTKIRSRNRKPK